MTRRSYRQLCGIAGALDLVGDRWALLVVRELLLGPKRFTDLAAGLPGIGMNTLSARLAELVEDGVVALRKLPPPAPAAVYELTGKGRELELILLALVRWGAGALPSRQGSYALRATWIGVAMKAYFHPSAAGGRVERIELVLPSGTLGVVVDGRVLEVVEGAIEGATLRVTAREPVLLAVLRGGTTVGDAISDGELTLEGDPARLRRALRAFAFPPLPGTV